MTFWYMTLTPFMWRVHHIKCYSKPISFKWMWVSLQHHVCIDVGIQTTLSIAALLLCPGKRKCPHTYKPEFCVVISKVNKSSYLKQTFDTFNKKKSRKKRKKRGIEFLFIFLEAYYTLNASLPCHCPYTDLCHGCVLDDLVDVYSFN